MRIGVVFPQTEFGSDPIAIRDYAQTAEGLGFTHIGAYDHVLGANPDRPGGWQGPYTYQSAFQEPFVLFAYMAAVTSTIEFAPGIIILPQRQTVLVAKQAATLDVLSGGRLRLGVALGWNEVEYIALHENFHTRGKRIEEQVALLRELWTKPLVTFNGKYHTIPDAGLNPLPVQRPIPIWFGGYVEPAIQRIARLADGWMMGQRPPANAGPMLAWFDRYLREAGRTRADVGLEARLGYGTGQPAEWRAALKEWHAAGATHLSFNTMGKGFATPERHIAALQEFAHVAL